jgi:hypothetical protein
MVLFLALSLIVCCSHGLALRAMLLRPAPQGARIGDVQLAIEPAKALKAHAVKHLVFAFFVAQVVQRLAEHEAHHDFAGVRWAATFVDGEVMGLWRADEIGLSFAARAGQINCFGDLAEVDELVHRCQVGNEAAQLGLAQFLHEQVGRRCVLKEGAGEKSRGFDARADHGCDLAKSTHQALKRGGKCPGGHCFDAHKLKSASERASFYAYFNSSIMQRCALHPLFPSS